MWRHTQPGLAARHLSNQAGASPVPAWLPRPTLHPKTPPMRGHDVRNTMRDVGDSEHGTYRASRSRIVARPGSAGRLEAPYRVSAPSSRGA